MPVNTETRDRNILLGGVGFALISAFLAVTWATPFASDASSEDLATFLGLLVVPLLTLVFGAILLSVGLASLFATLYVESEDRTGPSNVAPFVSRLAGLAMMFGIIGGGLVFVGWEMVSASTCSANHVSSMGFIGPICPIPWGISLLSDGLMIVGGLMAGAGALFAVALKARGRKAHPVRSLPGPD